VENEFSMKGHHNQTEVGIHISNKIGFRLKSVRRENEGHFISIKGTIHKEEISMKNICNKHVDANLHLKKFSIVPKRKIDSNTVIVEDLNTSLSPIDKSSRQKMKEETSELHHTLEQMDALDISREFHLTTRQTYSILQLMELSPK
jgi:hypothetical protein